MKRSFLSYLSKFLMILVVKNGSYFSCFFFLWFSKKWLKPKNPTFKENLCTPLLFKNRIFTEKAVDMLTALKKDRFGILIDGSRSIYNSGRNSMSFRFLWLANSVDFYFLKKTIKVGERIDRIYNVQNGKVKRQISNLSFPFRSADSTLSITFQEEEWRNISKNVKEVSPCSRRSHLFPKSVLLMTELVTS